MLVFAAVAPGDTEKDVETLAAKVLKMRLVRSRTIALLFLPSPPSISFAQMPRFSSYRSNPIYVDTNSTNKKWDDEAGGRVRLSQATMNLS